MIINSKLKIGNIVLENPVIPAPMAGISNNAFKSIMKEMGAGLITTEMVSDKAILYKNEKTLKMIDLDTSIHPVVIQIFGNDPSEMALAAKFLEDHSSCDIIDINMGCPAPKITKNNAGSKILLDTDKVYAIAKAVKDAVNIPVMAKIRVGWDENSIMVVENSKALERAGIDAISIHGRTTKQMYSGSANWDLIKLAKDSVNIPVIGNGDINTPQRAFECMQKYNVDGVMIGRAILGNPWLIRDTIHYFKTQELLPSPTLEQKLQAMTDHLMKLIDLKGEIIAIKEIRGLAFYYIKGIKGATDFKKAIQLINTVEDFHQVIKIFDNMIEQEKVTCI